MSAAVANAADRDLVLKARDGDRAAVGALIERYQRRAVSLAYRLLSNLEDAQEVAQKAFVKAYVHLHDLQDVERFGPWLLRIVANLSLNERRSRGARRTISIDLHADDPDDSSRGALQEAVATPEAHEAALVSSELLERVRAALERVPEQWRLPFVMHVQEEMPQKEVAEILGISVENVKFRIFKARAMLREMFADQL